MIDENELEVETDERKKAERTTRSIMVDYLSDSFLVLSNADCLDSF